MQMTPSLDAATDRVVRSTTLWGLVPAVVVGVALWFVNPIVAVLALILIASLWAVFVSTRVRTAVDRTIGPLATSPLMRGSNPRLENLLDGLCVTGGVARPTVLVLDTDAMNGLVVADHTDATLVLTRGLIDGLGRIELEGAIANLLGRQRDGSARYATVVTSLFGSSGYGGRRLAAGLGDQRAVRSDMAAVDLTRYPPGLISALTRMDEAGTAVPGAPARSVHLWLAPAAASGGSLEARLAETTMQPLGLRIAVLEEL